jgi:hypothetical protein
VGCLDKIGCAAVLAAGVAVGAWYWSDHLPDGVRRFTARAAHTVAGGATAVERRLDTLPTDELRRSATATGGAAPAATVPGSAAPVVSARTWVPLDSTRALDPAIARLAAREAPAYVTLTPAAFARLIAPALVPVLRPVSASRRAADASSSLPQIALDGHDVRLRTVVDLRAVAGAGAMRTALSAVVHGQDTVDVSGALTVEQPGSARYVIETVELRGVSLPSAVVPLIVRVLRQRAASPADTLSNALTIPLPRSIGDLRITQGRAILYRAVTP